LRKRRKHVRRLSVFALLAAVTSLVLAQTAFAQASQTYTTSLDTLNGSGASGNATVTVNGNQATVEIQSQGLTPGQPHAQHIHIGGQNVCPPPSADTDGSGAISTAEGGPFYGDIQVSLTTQGDVSADSGLAVDRMPVADDNGNLNYSRTFALPSGVSPADVANGVIVQHGIDFNGNGEYDASAGQSSADPSLPFEATAPAVCGELAQAGGVTDLPDTSGISLLTLALGGGLLLTVSGGLLFARTRRVW
jgi:hypothetical protein